jgi:drug/metabolite transporter (DMT)-like permease
MTGVLLASLAGVGFGFFQAFNRRAGRGFGVYTATFVLLLTSTVILVVASAATQDLSQLVGSPVRAYVNFGLAGFIHFFLGWTLLTASQNRVGAARTGALVGATPLFATFVAALAFEEFLRLPILVGVVAVVAGVYLVSVSKGDGLQAATYTWRDLSFGLGVAVCFSISPIFIRGGLDELPSPLLGVTIGMGITTIAYAIALYFRREETDWKSLTRDARFYQVAAGVMVGLSTWMRWVALDLSPVAVVLALGRLNVPVVILVSLLLLGQSEERVTGRVWFGALLIVAGSLLLIFFR